MGDEMIIQIHECVGTWYYHQCSLQQQHKIPYQWKGNEQYILLHYGIFNEETRVQL